jgi:hypothetical protein
MAGTSMTRIATRIQSSFRQVAAPARCCSKETEYYSSETCWQEEKRGKDEGEALAFCLGRLEGRGSAGLGGQGAREVVWRVGMEGWRVLTQD